jgi:hypothetical protein
MWLFALSLASLEISCLKGRDNPQDPLSPVYVTPTPALSLVAGTLFSTNTVTIAWTGLADVEFRYVVIDSLGALISNPHDFSKDSLAAHLSLLDDGPYTITVIGRYNSSHTDSSSVAARFLVSATQSPTLKFGKLRILQKNGNFFTVTIALVNDSLLFSGTFQLTFPKNMIQLNPQNGSSAVYPVLDPNAGLDQVVLPDFSDQNIVNAANSNGVAVITTGFLPMTGPEGIQGTHNILGISFVAMAKDTGQISISNVDFRDPANKHVSLNAVQSAQVIIR